LRYAVYLTPRREAELTAAAEAWLGRSAFTGATATPAAPAEAKPDSPARYGFHATMRAPFRLAEGCSEEDLLAAFHAFAGQRTPLPVVLELAAVSHFVALLARNEKPLCEAEREVLEAFDPLRAPLTPQERARRNPEALDRRGVELLDRWGYPHVLDRFRFHMTLSGPASPDAVDGILAAARDHFSPLLDGPHTLHYALFREETAGGPFSVVAIQDSQQDRTS
jgi:hypothetical protein